MTCRTVVVEQGQMRTRRAAGLTAILLLVAACTPAARRKGPDSAAVASASSGPVRRTASLDPIAHDPSMIKESRYYYIFVTGDSRRPNTYLPMMRSPDLVHWEQLGPVFPTPPHWVIDKLGVTPKDFWAPDINYVNGEYYLYYAASEFGVNNSVIGLATNHTLDPASPRYRWVDKGIVVRSQNTDSFNAIDPDLVFDEAGVPWLAFGSFWSGIMMRRLDARTGKPSAADTMLHHLADRGYPPNAVEGASIVRHGGYYYIFASFDYCCRGVDSDYHVVVGRAESVTGPYVDRAERPLLDGGGTDVLHDYGKFAGPGGGDVYVDGKTNWYVHHYYDRTDDGAPKLSVRRITWVEGWPTFDAPI